MFPGFLRSKISPHDKRNKESPPWPLAGLDTNDLSHVKFASKNWRAAGLMSEHALSLEGMEGSKPR